MILLLFLLQSVKCYITSPSNMGMSSNVMTDKTELISVQTENQPEIIGSNNSCINYSVHNTPNQNFLQMFKIDDLNKCWNYCKLTRSCLFFSFQLITRRCSLYTKLSIVPNKSRDFTLVVGDMICLQCLGNVDQVVSKSQTGLLIEREELGKCLAVSRTRVNLTDAAGFKLVWKSCSHASLWTINYRYDNNSHFVRVTLNDSDWSLETNMDPDSIENSPLVYLASLKNISLDESFLMNDEKCRYDFVGLTMLDGNRVKWNLFFDTNDMNSYNSLTSINLKIPVRNETCPLRRFVVKNGEVVNENKVQYFLPGEPVIIRCQPGYGVKSFNYTSYQIVTCKERVRPRPCSLVRSIVERRSKEEFVKCKIYLVVIIVMSILLLRGVLVYLARNCRCKARVSSGNEYLQNNP